VQCLARSAHMRNLPSKKISDRFWPYVIGTLDPFLGFAYTRSCSICGGRVESHRFGSSCGECWSTTQCFSNDDPLCFKCGRSMIDIRAATSLDCHQCSEHFYDNAAAVGNYSGALKQAILSLKSVPFTPTQLTDLLEIRLKDLGPDIDIVIPVPLSERRQFERGFNQAQVIAERIGRILEVDVDELSLARIKHSPMHRAGMDRKAREKTVTKAFAVQRPRLIDGKRILLIDDVLTSGSTASACAKELKANGAVSVSLFTIARA
jgi:competence protein ComFC